jgi:probable O-glycosylation ligase (exosortase A-associated)
MRDIALLMFMLPICVAALRYPFMGAMLWVWIALMNPHRLTFGFMFDGPVAQMVAICIFVGLFVSKERRNPLVAPPAVWFLIFILWMCVTTALSINLSSSLTMLEKVLKITVMVLVVLMLVRTRREIMVLAWVMGLSLAFYGVKGGLFTLATGGSYRVYGPNGSYIQENNALAVALIMTIPLLRFLQTTLEKRWQRWAMTGAMLLCAVSVFGSHSRGALLSISAMAVLLWWRGKNKLVTAGALAMMVLLVLPMMPEHWWERMQTIETYQEDQSAMGRIGAWTMATNLALDRIVGGGFAIWRADLFARYSPEAPLVVSAHSIYFHVIGEHGFIGLFIYLSMWTAAYLSGGWLRRHAAKQPETQWAATLGGMSQVSLVGFAVGGAFLSLTYYDLPFYLLALVCAARWWVQSGAWQHEPPFEPLTRVMGVPIFGGDRLVRPVDPSTPDSGASDPRRPAVVSQVGGRRAG